MNYGFIAEEYKEAIANLELDNFKCWVDFSVQTVSNGRTTQLCRLKPPAPLPGCYAKVYHYPRWRDRMRIMFRGGLVGTSRAGAEFRNLKRLNKRGLAPRVIAFGHQRSWGLLHLSLLVTEEVKGAVPLDQFVADSLSCLSLRKRKKLLSTLAEFTRKMNAGRYVNGQYHWRNILVLSREDEFAFQVIDPSSSRWRYRWFCPLYDLATLDVCAAYFFTRTERLRFFKSYQCAANKPLTCRQKKQVRQIVALRDKIAESEIVRYRFMLPCS